MNGVEILLVEDNPEDVEITLRAFQKYHLANKIHVVRDGEEALECLFGTGRYAEPNNYEKPRLILLDSEVAESRRTGSLAEVQNRSEHQGHPCGDPDVFP